MNKKFWLLSSGAIALMLATSPLMPGAMKAAMADTAHGHRGGHGMMAQLNLTDAQKSQIQQYRQSEKQQIDGILTDDQKAAIQQARQNHTRPNLNLSDDQKTQMKAIHQQTEANIKAVLTPAQQQQLQQAHAARN
jgi:Spy/CpxP family protein refolding chaperone